MGSGGAGCSAVDLAPAPVVWPETTTWPEIAAVLPRTGISYGTVVYTSPSCKGPPFGMRPPQAFGGSRDSGCRHRLPRGPCACDTLRAVLHHPEIVYFPLRLSSSTRSTRAKVSSWRTQSRRV